MAEPRKALLIPEVLTCILLEVDNNTLVKAQRVCRQWRDLIQASPDLEVKLFFKPALAFPFADGTPSLNPIFTSSWSSIISPWTQSMRSRKDSSWQRMLVFQPYLQTMLIFEDESDLSDSPPTPFRATVLRFEPEVIKHRDQLRVSQIHCRELWHCVLSLPIATRIKDGRDGKEVTHVSWKNILVVSDSFPADVTFLKRMFFNRANRPCADFYDLVFIRKPWEILPHTNLVQGRDGQWSEKVLSPLEKWLQSVEPWVRVEKQWCLSRPEYKELSRI
ncbi:hypothetical protein ASPCAL02691 [Aspergillus calidoustus]|uniref:F-box domain-containing protein n=1 Tax=Aspergillus calidoustus TaxID=454130 RepID=A0A0U5GL92_ASPCI|nr:hypothetical protein ASPCAL02691 [Aspergillus calidoustus]